MIGDFNIPGDCASGAEAKMFAELLNTFGLIQHVQGPTHSSGHTLDLVMSRSTNFIVIDPLATLALSDHSLVKCSLIFLVQS